jgi:hypothetical protein
VSLRLEIMLALSSGLVVGGAAMACVAVLVVLLGRPSPECEATCAVLEGEALVQAGRTVWCTDDIEMIYTTHCEEP